MRSQKERSKPTPPPDLWEQMDSIVGAPPKDDPGISLQEFADRYRVSPQNAGVRLRQLVSEGKVIAGRRKTTRGHFINVYRPA